MLFRVLLNFFLILSLSASLFAAQDRPHVVILGGGVSGLSAAHELAERGFRVTVYETKSIPGGKARSIDVPLTGTNGRANLPGEHGFRFFPGFYRHLPDTMSRIPFEGNANGVLGNLVAAHRLQAATADNPGRVLPTRPPKTFDDFYTILKFALFSNIKISNREMLHFSRKLWVLMSSCDGRRHAEFENISWWKYIGAAGRSKDYQKFLAVGLTRTLVAAKAETASARTVGTIFLQLLYNGMGFGDATDRLLNGPTNEVWINPWIKYLTSLGVDYQVNAAVESIESDGKVVTGAVIRKNGEAMHVTADYYISAVPVEVLEKLVTPQLEQGEPRLRLLPQLHTEWMTGIQFFLNKDVPIVEGHSIYFDTPWALTSVSQRQFWRGRDLSKYGDGSIKGIISVDISNWEVPGILYGKRASACTADEIKNEVLAQLKSHWRPEVARTVDAHLVKWFLDPGITFPEPGRAENSEPLLVNTKGSWLARPDAVTKIPNFFLAGDYVRTNTDLATMEGANESARRAVNGILDASGSSAERCKVWRLREPPLLHLERKYDALRFRLGLKNRWDKFDCAEILLGS